jgi:predicted transposase/invertase (TIGR01784 family)
MRYLDPKNDLTFKKIFGNHPNLVRSLLNSLLPLTSPIETVEYLQAEQVPQIPVFKNSIVDVKCTDQNKRVFIVEMQMFWTESFKQRVVFNASKSYVMQLGKSVEYQSLKPVYALSLVNEIFEHDTTEYYHHYSLVHSFETDKKLEGLEFVFVELPKFKPQNLSDKKMTALWLRFLTEITDGTVTIAPELLANEEIKEAVDILEESSFSASEVLQYDKFWDSVRVEASLYSDATKRGEKIGREEGILEAQYKIARELLKNNIPIAVIAQSTGLSEMEIIKITED